ncbi:ribonucleotide reductase subunit 2 [Wood mouse herpesvirus]|uniref:ribonucleoside-diphosphate reductase n=1 Tax=Wood mouse herpesvirus TaxID=432370 RepID=D0U1P9_9GAMA|nr:ribonucleotide reductase subunit 2 [Wood mouse herpesvirus]ACY41130.1 ribonucleotide reductase subunit 2 [Wood mouse herpesvirus]
MDFVKEFLYVSDHAGFLELTTETWKNRWFPSQIPLSSDVAGIAQLNATDREFYKFLFVFLGLAEKLVNFNIEDLVKEFNCHDATHYYAEQMAMENIHGKVYANILQLFFNGDMMKLKEYAVKVVADPTLKAKLDWLHTRVKNTKTRAEKVLIFLLIEGIFFISSFYSISLFRVRGMLNGICLANDYISKDELLHTRAAAVLYNTLIPAKERPDPAWIKRLFQEAVEVEYAFIAAKSKNVTLVVPGEIKRFLQATCDRILQSIGVGALYGSHAPVTCPLSYNGCIKSVNFFEREGTDYSTKVTNDL